MQTDGTAQYLMKTPTNQCLCIFSLSMLCKNASTSINCRPGLVVELFKQYSLEGDGRRIVKDILCNEVFFHQGGNNCMHMYDRARYKNLARHQKVQIDLYKMCLYEFVYVYACIHTYCKCMCQ